MNPYCQLAKSAVESIIKEKRIIQPSKSLPESFFKEKAGAFVSIHKDEELRGCIGTFLPTQENIAQEIISSAISACQDSRFEPITENELKFLSYEVYILEEPKPIKDFSELNPKKYGVLVRSLRGNKTGLLLPDLEGVNDTETQLYIACQKAGINPQKEEISVYKFSAQKYVSN